MDKSDLNCRKLVWQKINHVGTMDQKLNQESSFSTIVSRAIINVYFDATLYADLTLVEPQNIKIGNQVIPGRDSNG